MKPLPRPPMGQNPFPPEVKAPQIDDELLDQLASQIKPLVPNDDGHLWYIKPVNLRTSSFIWDPEFTDRAEDLVVFTTLRTLHTFPYYGTFKPSIAEVLAHLHVLPLAMRSRLVAFHLAGPSNATDLNYETEALRAGYQVAYATFYEKR